MNDEMRRVRCIRRSLLLYLVPAALAAQSAVDHFKAGRAAYEAKNADAAVTAFEQAAALDDRNAEYHLWLARAIGLQSEHASFVRVPFLARRMKAEYERTVQLDPSSLGGRMGLLEVYLGPGMFGGSVASARAEADSIAERNALRGHFARATIANHEKDSTAAEREWRAAAAEFPDSLSAVTALVQLLLSTRRDEEAFATAARFLARRPADARDLYNLGAVSAATGRELDRGELALRAVLATPGIGTDSAVALAAQAHLRLGDILTRKGARDPARKEYEAALRLNPSLEAAKRALRQP